MTDPVLFIIAVVTLLATPGPTNALLLTAATLDGPRSLRLIPAEVTGYLLSVLAIALLVAPLVAELWMVGVLMRSIAAAYLLLVAARLWRGGSAAVESPQLITPRHVFTTTLLNPKAILFGLGIVPVQGSGGMAYLAGFCLLITAVGSAWILLGVLIRRGLLPPGGAPLIPRIAATVITGFAGLLVLSPLL
jgi:threonine/homoserine/homoserine lactone efflux protein